MATTIARSRTYGSAIAKGRYWAKHRKKAGRSQRFAIEERGKFWHTLAL